MNLLYAFTLAFCSASIFVTGKTMTTEEKAVNRAKITVIENHMVDRKLASNVLNRNRRSPDRREIRYAHVEDMAKNHDMFEDTLEALTYAVQGNENNPREMISETVDRLGPVPGYKMVAMYNSYQGSSYGNIYWAKFYIHGDKYTVSIAEEAIW